MNFLLATWPPHFRHPEVQLTSSLSLTLANKKIPTIVHFFYRKQAGETMRNSNELQPQILASSGTYL